MPAVAHAGAAPPVAPPVAPARSVTDTYFGAPVIKAYRGARTFEINEQADRIASDDATRAAEHDPSVGLSIPFGKKVPWAGCDR